MTRAKALYFAVERVAIMAAAGSVATFIYAWWRDSTPDWSIVLSWPYLLMIGLTGILTFFRKYGDQR